MERVDPLDQEEWPLFEASDHAFLNEVQHSLRFTGFPILAQGELPDAPLDRVSVIKNLVFRAPCHALSDIHPLTLAEIAAGRDFSKEAQAAQSSGGQKNKRIKRTPGSLLEQFPGLAATLEGGGAGHGRARGSGEPAEAADDEGEAGPDYAPDDDEVIQAFYDDMERIRPDVSGVAPPPMDQVDFRYRTRAEGDSVQGQVVRGGEAQEWCKRNRLQQTMKFRIADLGLDQANVLANAWAVRMQFLYDHDKAGLLAPADRRERTLATMVWPEGFVDLQEQGTESAKDRAAQL
eukprot:1239782-Lingulodinium_polyedra.AAC.1